MLAKYDSIKHGKFVRYQLTSTGFALLDRGSYAYGQADGLWHRYYKTATKPQFKVYRRGEAMTNEPLVFIGTELDNSLLVSVTLQEGKQHGLFARYYLDSIPNMTEAEGYGKRKNRIHLLNIEQKGLSVQEGGMFSDNKKTGDWYYFDRQGKLIQHYNYTNSSLRFDRSFTDTLQYQTHPPLFWGGLDMLKETLYERFRLPLLAKIAADTLTAIVTFIIGSSGTVGQVKLEQATKVLQFDDELMRIVPLAGTWLPALNNNKAVACQYKVMFEFYRQRLTNKPEKLLLIISPMPGNPERMH